MHVLSNQRQPGGISKEIQEGCSLRTNAGVAAVKWPKTLKGASIIFSLAVHSTQSQHPAFPAARAQKTKQKPKHVIFNYSVVYYIVVINIGDHSTERQTGHSVRKIYGDYYYYYYIKPGFISKFTEIFNLINFNSCCIIVAFV